MPSHPGSPSAGQSGDVVETADDAAGLTKPPLLILDRVRAFLDEHGLGSGEVRARRIGEGGGSNFTFLLERDDGEFVLRRPPRPPLPPSAHDVVREARLQLALREAGFSRLPTIVAVGEDESILGVPFYVMTYLEGHVPTDELPPGLEDEGSRRSLGDDLVDALVEIHAADVTTPALAAFARPGSYNERQVRRFAQLWGINKTRELPQVDRVGAWLADNVPDPLAETVVHGDFRLGNTMVSPDDPSRIVAVLDWEMGAIGDPRADVGYLLATYSEPGGPPNPLGTSPVTALPGFPSRADLVDAVRGAQRPRRRAAGLVRGAGALEGRRVLRGDLRPLPARRARRGGRASRPLRAGRPVPRRRGRGSDRARLIRQVSN